MKFVVVTGMSGAGKRTAMKMLEDTGFYCVDNLPAALISTFVELITLPKSDINKVALGLDVRSDKSFREINQTLVSMKSSGLEYEILFMDASDEILIKRYKESRRVHPIEGSCTEESIKKERQILQEIRSQADYIIDTSSLLTRELKEELDRIFVKNEAYNSLMIQIMSFGFKHGIPLEADLVFDVRFLPNPFYIEDLKYKTGNDEEVSKYVMSFPEADGFLDKLTDMIQFLIPNYIKEGKYRLAVCIGCTGGRHRSVTLANALFDRMKNMGDYGLTLMHRDVDRSN